MLLVALGVTPDGHKEVIAFKVTNGETRQAWESFLQDLYRRGLRGANLRLITTDGGGGVQAGVELAYPHVPRQRCWFHPGAPGQNVAQRVRRRDQQAVLKGLRAVYAAKTRRAALQACAAWGRRWQARYPKAVALVERDLEELLAVFELPEEHRRMGQTTNPIERTFREVRRRTRSIGTFVNDASIARIVYGLVAYFNRKYAARLCPAFRKQRQVA